ncbi:MAG: RDD family protein [Chromatiales bacterium]|nr:RDD family protein [Chromatiales bacterium]
MTQPEPTPSPAKPLTEAGLMRRLAAASYDLALVLALWALATLVIVITRGGEPVPEGNWPYRLLLLAITAGFFSGFWVRGGQTLGMRAWRLQLRAAGGAPVDWPAALRRFALLALPALAWLLAIAAGRPASDPLAALPAGLLLAALMLWRLFDPDQRTALDRLAATRMIVLPRKPGS